MRADDENPAEQENMLVMAGKRSRLLGFHNLPNI